MEPLAVFKLCSVAGVTILLSLTVFLNLVAETLPQVSDAIPLLGTNRSMSDLPVLTTLPSVLPDYDICVSLCICDCLYPRAFLLFIILIQLCSIHIGIILWIIDYVFCCFFFERYQRRNVLGQLARSGRSAVFFFGLRHTISSSYLIILNMRKCVSLRSRCHKHFLFDS